MFPLILPFSLREGRNARQLLPNLPSLVKSTFTLALFLKGEGVPPGNSIFYEAVGFKGMIHFPSISCTISPKVGLPLSR